MTLWRVWYAWVNDSDFFDRKCDGGF
jgi:hypothetical protein